MAKAPGTLAQEPSLGAAPEVSLPAAARYRASVRGVGVGFAALGTAIVTALAIVNGVFQ